MSDVPEGGVSEPGDPDHEIFDMQAFRDNGLVWALNRFVLHPRGLAMWMHAVPAGAPEDEQTAAGWGVKRAEDGIWSFDAETDLLGRDKFGAFMAYISERASAAVMTEPEDTKNATKSASRVMSEEGTQK